MIFVHTSCVNYSKNIQIVYANKAGIKNIGHTHAKFIITSFLFFYKKYIENKTFTEYSRNFGVELTDTKLKKLRTVFDFLSLCYQYYTVVKSENIKKIGSVLQVAYHNSSVRVVWFVDDRYLLHIILTGGDDQERPMKHITRMENKLERVDTMFLKKLIQYQDYLIIK
jgi:hypothetical protein